MRSFLSEAAAEVSQTPSQLRGPRARGWGPSRAGWQQARPRAGRGELRAPVATQTSAQPCGPAQCWESRGDRGSGTQGQRSSSRSVPVHPGPRGRLVWRREAGCDCPGVHQHEVIKSPVLSWACS